MQRAYRLLSCETREIWLNVVAGALQRVVTQLTDKLTAVS